MKKVKKMQLGGVARGVQNAVRSAAPAAAMSRIPSPGAAGSPMSGIGNAVRNAVAGQKASQIAGKLGSMARPMFKKAGGKVSSASKRADGIATKGKTKGKMI